MPGAEHLANRMYVWYTELDRAEDSNKTEAHKVTWGEFRKRAAALSPRFEPHSGAYEVRTRDGRRGWMALSEVWDYTQRRETRIHQMYPTPSTIYRTEAEATGRSLVEALVWAERGLPALP